MHELEINTRVFDPLTQRGVWRHYGYICRNMREVKAALASVRVNVAVARKSRKEASYNVQLHIYNGADKVHCTCQRWYWVEQGDMNAAARI